jgi:hypothetical protein
MSENTTELTKITKKGGDATDVAVAAGLGGALGLTVGMLAAGPIGAIGLGLIYAAQCALCAATGHEPNSYDVS